MKSRVLLTAAVAIIIAAIVYWFAQRPTEASLLLINGKVYVVDESNSTAGAIAIKGDRIIGVGTTEEILAQFSSGYVIDLKGKAVYPGFTDSHAHLEGLGAMLVNIDLRKTKSVKEIQVLVAERAKTTPEGSWIRGRAWDQNKWPVKEFPDHQMLDEVSGTSPVYLKRVDGHAVWVNKKVLEIAGITRDTQDPEGGKILRDAKGDPTGVFIDNAVDMLDSVVPAPTEEDRTLAIVSAIEECVRFGLTQVHDMGVDLEGINIYKKLIAEGKFPLRVYAAIGGIGPTWDHYLTAGPEIGLNGGRLSVRALKLYQDGALGSRGAALIEPYSDDPTNRGLTLTAQAEMKKAALAAIEKGFQVCTHAIGDRANHIVLNVYEDAFKARQINGLDVRFRVEHAQVLEGNDISRFHKLGVLPMMQQTHCTSDMYWAEERLGSTRSLGAYAWRSLMNEGSIVPGGSDFPVEGPNPLWGFYAAVTRQDHDGWPPEGWHPDQVMTRAEALKSFTIWGAYAAFEEKMRGSIEVGKLADFTILSDDIMEIEPDRILKTNVDFTIIGGEVVYSSGK